jgi:hypothetical protein
MNCYRLTMPLPALIKDLDWGSVPAWLGAGSLLLAFVVFLRNRGNAERAQVDLIGAWALHSMNLACQIHLTGLRR